MTRTTVVPGSPRARRRRVGISVGLVLAVLVALLGPAAPAQAKKTYPTKSQIAAAKSKAERTRAAVARLTSAITAADKQMEGLQTKAEQAAEAYNAAQSKLDTARQTAASAQSAADNAQAQLLASREQLGRFAAASYRSGGDIANVGALLSADGPGTLMDRANTISVLATQRETALQRVESARVVAELLNQQAKGALAGVQAATVVVRDAQRKAQAAFDDQAAEVTKLNTQKVALRKQLAKLDKNAAALAERRAAALRAAAAAKAAAEAKANGGTVLATAPPGTSIGTTAGAAKAVAFAKKQLGKWYLWGGAGPDRFDCSGLTMRAWQKGGVQIPRVASWQYAAAGKVSTNSLRPGDLLFYATDLSDWNTIHHVGIYVGGGRMIEAPHTGAQIRYSSIWRSDLIGAGRP